MQSPSFIKALVTPGPGASQSRKSWSIDLETVWVPFFTATNAQGDTAVSHDTLGKPLRLATAKDGTVRFTQSGRPSMRIAPELSQEIKIVRESFVASLVAFTGNVIEENGDAYRNQVELNQAAGTPLEEQEDKMLQEEYARIASVEAVPEEKAVEEEAPAPRRRRRKTTAAEEAPVEAVSEEEIVVTEETPVDAPPVLEEATA